MGKLACGPISPDRDDSARGGGISIADVQIIKDLTSRIGAAKIHELVDVLSR